jgi:hypothetical protein
LTDGDAWLEPAYSVKSQSRGTALQGGTVPLANRHKDIGGPKEWELRREHTYYRVALVIQRQTFTHNILRTAKLALPEVCADHDQRGGAGLIFTRGKCPTQRRVHTEHRKEVCGDQAGANALRFTRAYQTEAEPARNRHGREGPILSLHVTKIRVRDGACFEIRLTLSECHKLLGLRKRQRIQ